MSVKEETDGGIETIGKAVEFKLPGQRFATPAPANGDRVFYESLLDQNPQSALAQEWCVSYGTLDEKTALSLLAIINKRKEGGGGNGKSVISPKKATPAKAARPAPAAKKAPAGKKK